MKCFIFGCVRIGRMTIDSNTFNDFFTEYRQRFVRFVTSYLRDDTLAEDVVVESMMAFWTGREALPDDTNVPAYVLRIIRNRCIDLLRRKKTGQVFLDRFAKSHEWDLSMRISSLEDFIPEKVFTNEIQQIVSRTVASMSEETRRVYSLSYREGRSHKEIASRLGISEKGVEYHITKVHRLLREALKDYVSFSLFLFCLL